MANQRILASEEMVGFGHGVKADTLNRQMMVEHAEDGSHVTDKIIAATAAGLTLEDDGGNGIEITDGGTIHMATQSGFSASLSGNQDIPSAATTTVEFDTEEDDVQGEFNVGTYTFTAAKDGIYLVSASLYFSETIADTKAVQTWIYKNAAPYTVTGATIGATLVAGFSITARMPLVATDTVYIRVYQSNAVARQLDNNYCRFSIAKIA